MDALKLETGFDPDLGKQLRTSEQPLPPVRHAHVQDLHSLRSETGFGTRYTDLGQLILLGRTCLATDLRDKVFAMLGMADPDVYGLVPDYRLLPRQVVIAATRAIISKTFKLDILCAAQNPDRLNDLPSWAPNLSDHWKAWPLPQEDGWSPTMKTFTAIGIAFGGVDGAETLTVKGTRFGSIALLCPEVVGEGDTTTELQDTYMHWRTFSEDPAFENKRGPYDHDMKYDLLSERNEYHWLYFISIGTEKHHFPYADNGTLLPSKQEGVKSQFGGEPDDRPKTYLVPSDFHGFSTHPCAKIHAAMRKHALGRCLGFSETGCFGLFPGDSKPGDLIVSIPGAFHPLVLRKHDDAFVLVGQAFVLYQSHYVSDSHVPEDFILV